MDAGTLRQLHSVYQAQKTQKAHQQIERTAGALLDLALATFGPMPVEANGANCSQADAIRFYAEQNAEFCALVFIAGMGETLRLPKPEQKHFDCWGAVQARAHQQPPRRKARKGR